jgi:hypothetical protein
MKQRVTLITRAAIYFMGLAVFSINTILLPELAREEAAGRANPPITYPFFIGAWILSIPIFIALHQTLKLLKYIDENRAFSNRSVKVLQNIKLCAIVYGVLVALSAISIVVVGRIMDPTEDTPPFLLVGSVFTLASIVVATFAAVLQRLLQDAIGIKEENDLIV